MREFRARARLEAASAEVLTAKIEVAARRVGFKRGSDFCRWFKKETGSTPQQFRQLSDDRRREILGRGAIGVANHEPAQTAFAHRSSSSGRGKGSVRQGKR
jgi:AraC-like DNA-binding protein